MSRREVTMAAAATAALVTAWSGAYAGSMTLELEFVDHIKMEMIEQDVYIERSAGSGEVFRVGPEEKDAFADAQVFRAADPVHHNPFDASFNGPYPQGEELGFTLGEWLSGTGKGTYTCTDGKGSLSASFENLVPSAIYTMWYFFLPTPPPEPFGTYDLPVGARNGSESMFTTDASGNATYEVNFEPCLQMGGEQLAAGLAINYHSDGQTYGPHPGEFGTISHIQLFTILPNQKDVAMAQ